MNTDQQTEEWVKVHGYPDYEVSSLGEVRRTVGGHKKTKSRFAKFMCGAYHAVKIKDNATGVYKSVHIHRLVATAFALNPYGLPCVNHKDGNKLNNDRGNLEWCTYSQNIDHAFRTGLRKSPSGEYNGRHILSSPQVIEILACGRAGASGMSLSRKYNVSHATISCILRGKTWSSVTGIQQQPKLAAA